MLPARNGGQCRIFLLQKGEKIATWGRGTVNFAIWQCYFYFLPLAIKRPTTWAAKTGHSELDIEWVVF